jgi:probable phosphoglycerate mutase
LTRFLLIRHGDTDAVGHYLAGVAPGTHLNDAGRAQVARLVERLHPLAIGAVVSSPLERTRQTAEPIARDHGIDVEVDPAFIEYDVAGWTGATFSAMEANDDWRRFNAVRSLTRADQGELMIEVQQRAVTALLRLRARYPSGTVVVVSHGDVIRAMLLFVLGMPMDFFNRVEVLPARISVVDVTDESARVLLVNGDSVTEDL